MNFNELGLSESTLQALEKKGFTSPTPIQALTIPLFLKSETDIIGKAQTGTGKTAAFAIPLLELLDENSKNVQALVLTPTRELALQVAEEFSSLKGNKRFFVQSVYGGQSYDIQIRGLRKGAQVVVGTPGRLRDHIEKGTLQLSNVTHMIIDEADEMLNMGFLDEVEDILRHIPENKRMLLFSATMPPEILRLAKKFMKNYELVEVKAVQLTTDLIDQMYFEVRHTDRFEALCRIIDTEPEFYGIIFCRTKMETDEVANKLVDRGFDAEAIHGDVTQFQRELILKKFKYKKVNIMVATDVAARGIDISDLTHVINYNLPQDPEAYVHRIGRTGRAGKHGTAITIISPNEYKDLMFIQKIAKAKIRKEEVPSVADVINTKAMKLRTEISQILAKNEHQAYTEIATELLQDGASAEEVLAAVLTHALRDSLNAGRYHEISDVSSRNSSGNNNMARLFVAKGHADDMNLEKLATWLADETGIDRNVLHDIRVFDAFSFVTVPFAEADVILNIFSKKSKGKPLVTKAKDPDRAGGGGGFRGGYDKGPRSGGGRYKDKREDRGGDRERSGGDRDRGSRYGGDRDRGPRRASSDFKSREGGSEFKPRERSEFKPREAGSDFKPRERSSEYKPKERGERREFNKPAGEGDAPAPKKRNNKLTDYLDKKEEKGKSAFIPKKSDKSSDYIGPKGGITFNDDDLSW